MRSIKDFHDANWEKAQMNQQIRKEAVVFKVSAILILNAQLFANE